MGAFGATCGSSQWLLCLVGNPALLMNIRNIITDAVTCKQHFIAVKVELNLTMLYTVGLVLHISLFVKSSSREINVVELKVSTLLT